MSRLFIVIIIILVALVPVMAQDDDTPAPDYRVQALDYEISSDASQITINFGVSNIGGDAAARASAELTDLSNGVVIARAVGSIRPLGSGGDTVASSITFPTALFPPESNQALEIAVGVDEIEDADSPTIGNNRVGISVEIPFYEADDTAAPTNATPDSPAEDGEAADTTFVIPLLDVEIDPSDNTQLAIVAGIGLSIIIMLWLLVLIIRLLFRRSPKFGNWQPPYATMPPLDPNSTFGRRQLWQQHAQNNIVPIPCQMGTIYARKVLMGMDGQYLSGWRIMALRMTQYDMYGRVSRTEILANGAMVKTLDRIARRNARLDDRKIARRVRPVAKALARQFRKNISKRSALLPIALDVSLQGRHGEVRILFELYECRRNQPAQIDYWEPEMTVVGKTIHESYTYSIYGQSGGENFREFRNRISDNIERLLVAMLWAPSRAQTTETQPPPQPDADTLRNTAKVQAAPPDEEESAQETQITGGSA